MNYVSYRLPTSFVVVAGTVARTIDQLDEMAAEDQIAWNISLKDYSISVVTEGDGPTYFVSPTRGNWLWAYRGSFTTTVDGRLTSASGESSGALGTVVKSAIGIAGAALGIRRFFTESVPAPVADRRLETAFGASRPELDRYALEHPDEYAQARRLSAVTADLHDALVESIRDGYTDGSDPERTTRLCALEQVADAALARARAHYDAWRERKRVTLEDKFEIRVRVQDVPTALPKPAAGDGSPQRTAPTDLRDLWWRFGIGVTATWPDGERSADAVRGKHKPARGAEDQFVLVRQPDLMQLVVTRRTPDPDGDRFHGSVVSRSRHWVADTTSAHRWLRLEKSIWGRRSLKLRFDASGFLIGVSTDADAPLATPLTVLAEAPKTVASGLEAITKAGRAS